jgi:ABC-type anion transport system duplicated permease subunit
MDAPATSVLTYILWPLLTLTTAALWLAAILDISRHRRKETFTGAKLLGMATLVSVVAVIAIAGISAVLAGQWVETVSRASSYEIQATKLEGEGSAHAYIFSFGLENAYGSPGNPTGANESENGLPH